MLSLRRSLMTLIVFFLGAAILAACNPAANSRLAWPSVKVRAYEDPDGPKFEGQYAPSTPSPTDQIVVVTYNIRHGEKVREAGQAFQTFDRLKQADIVLLQEMDETGVEQLAALLGYNYVYYPATVARDGSNVGNAILARWPLRDPSKVILPYRHPVNGQRRIATRATVDLGETDALVYSVHTETIATLPSHREAQVDAIVQDIGPGFTPVIVGGDFNTVTRRGSQHVADQFASIGLQHATADVGPTISKLGLRPATADHIFTRGFDVLAAGVLYDAGASDHFPVWAQLEE